MELLAFGGASLVWNPRRRISIDAVRGNCKSFGEITVRRRWNPFGVSVVDKRGGNGVGVRKTVQARGDNVQDGYNSASGTMNEWVASKRLCSRLWDLVLVILWNQAFLMEITLRMPALNISLRTCKWNEQDTLWLVPAIKVTPIVIWHYIFETSGFLFGDLTSSKMCGFLEVNLRGINGMWE